MHKFLLFLLLGFVVLMELPAQRVQYFTNVNRDSVSVQSLQGVDLSLSIGTNARLGYFKEVKLGRTFTLNLTGNVIVARVPVSYNYADSTSGYNGGLIESVNYGPGFFMSLSVEPRWYFDYISRTVNFRNTKLNSGFFLSMPVTVLSGQINPSDDLPFQSKFFNLNPYIEPGIGYRYAIGKNFFLEANASLRIFGLQLGEFFLAPDLKIKGGFTF